MSFTQRPGNHQSCGTCKHQKKRSTKTYMYYKHTCERMVLPAIYASDGALIHPSCSRRRGSERDIHNGMPSSHSPSKLDHSIMHVHLTHNSHKLSESMANRNHEAQKMHQSCVHYARNEEERKGVIDGCVVKQSCV
jgi:hypothetical protein